ncbi:MAG: hypothetical protein JJT78_05315 [Leptospira sp.]|nr:hypothetical protein [Leptospira sp.]
MKFGSRRYIFLILVMVFIHCSPSKSSSPDDEGIIVLAWLQQQSITSRENSIYDCSDSDGRFQTMLDSGPREVCTQCHNEELRVNDFVITNYRMVQSRTIPGYPSQSLIYLKITEGSMRNYANSSIQKGIYCWIWNGSLN